MTAPTAKAVCSMRTHTNCRMWTHTTGRPTHIVVGDVCQSCKSFVPWDDAPSYCVTCMIATDISATAVNASGSAPSTKAGQEGKSAFAEQVLAPLGGAVVHMTFLKHLGLHRLPCTLPVIRHLDHVFHNLPSSVLKLTLSFDVPDDNDPSPGSTK